MVVQLAVGVGIEVINCFGMICAVDFQMLSRSEEDMTHIPIQRTFIKDLLCTSNAIYKTTNLKLHHWLRPLLNSYI